MMIRFVAVLALFAAVPGPAGASEVRTAAIGGIEGAVDDEATAFSLFNLDNAAGLGLLDRENRLDWAIGLGGATQQVDNGSVTTKRTLGDAVLRSPGGRYEGLVWWLSGSDVVRLSADMDLATLKTATTPPEPDADQKVSFSNSFLAVQYGRRLGENLALGVIVRPRFGALTLPSTSPAGMPRITKNTNSFSMLDFNVGAGLRVPMRESALMLGLNFQPYNDAPDVLALLDPASLGSVNSGGFKLKREIVVENGIKQTMEVTPAGSVLGLQGTLAGRGPFEGVFALDITSAVSKEKDTTDASAVAGGAAKTEEGTLSTFSRTRWTMGGRYRFALGEFASLRTALTLHGEPSKTEAEDFPNSTAVLNTTKGNPVTLALGIAYHTVQGLTVGLGWDNTGDTQTTTNASGGTTRQVKPSVSSIRLGGEYWFTPAFAGRLALVSAVSQQEDNDPLTPPAGSSPDNPKTKDGAIVVGAGYKASPVCLDLLIAVHSITEDPAPAPPVKLTNGRLDIVLAAKLVF